MRDKVSSGHDRSRQVRSGQMGNVLVMSEFSHISPCHNSSFRGKKKFFWGRACESEKERSERKRKADNEIKEENVMWRKFA